MIVRPYRDDDEEGWLRCRVLAFLHTAFFDDVRREKERYDSPSIELVAEDHGTIVGLIDVELDSEDGGMIWHLAGRTSNAGTSRAGSRRSIGTCMSTSSSTRDFATSGR